MAIQTTLGLPELLESIIAHLPEHDILCNAQRVSRGWKIAIDSSPTIQKKISLQPEEQPAISPVGYDQDEVKIFCGTPIYSRTTLINPLFTSKNCIHVLQVSRDFAIKMGPMKVYGKSTLYHHFYPNLMMAPPMIYWQTKTQNESLPSTLPSWRKMYLSQPPVTTVMLMIAYHHSPPPNSRNMFKVMIREKTGVTLGLVYETLATTMPACDESFGIAGEFDAIVAHVCWHETDKDGDEDCGSEDKGNEGDESQDNRSEEDDSDEDSSGGDGDGDEGSVTYDSDGNVVEHSSSENYEYAEHESELESDTGYEAADDEELVGSHLQMTE